MRAGSLRDPRYFEELYTRDVDPYGFDSNPDEQLKFARVMEMRGPTPFGRVLELGCAVGTITEILAPRCRELVAVDISRVAISTAAERLSACPSVTCEVRNLPDELPSGQFDLIIASDVSYYWTKASVGLALTRFEEALRPGGSLVAAHYTPRWGTMLTGDEVHDLLTKRSTLHHTIEETVEFGAGRPYRLDRYDKT